MEDKRKPLLMTAMAVMSLLLGSVTFLTLNGGLDPIAGALGQSSKGWTCGTISFAKLLGDGSTDYGDGLTEYSATPGLGISSITGSKIFNSGSTTAAAKLGSSKANGSMTITFSSPIVIGQISVDAATYGSDTTSIALSVNDKTLFTTSTLTSDSANYDLFYEPNQAITVPSFTISTTSKRAYLFDIRLGYFGYGEKEEESSSEQEQEEPSTASSSSSSSSSSYDPYSYIDTNAEREAFETDPFYEPASSYEDAQYRSKHGLISGTNQSCDFLPPTTSSRHMSGGLYQRNTTARYTYRPDGSYESYTILNEYGNVQETIYYGGAYTSLDEVASYLLAFGETPANMGYGSGLKSVSSVPIATWWRAARINFANFSGPTASRYTYEPACPGMALYNTSGKATLDYAEVDWGDWKSYNTASYVQNQGAYTSGSSAINRGVLRMIFVNKYIPASSADSSGHNVSSTVSSLNESVMGEEHINDRYVFYTYDHYGDFQEYLNYFGGWGKRFGAMEAGNSTPTGTKKKPTPYPKTASFSL